MSNIDDALLNPIGLPDIAEPEMDIELDDVNTEPTEDGGVIVDFSGDKADEIMESKEGIEFEANLAEHMDEADLDELADELVNDYNSDRLTRKDWEKTYIKGLDLLGMKYEQRTTPWPGASGVYHPLLAESVVRYQSQTIMEVFPPAGPVRTAVVGKMTPQKAKQAERVEDELNYLITQKMPEYRPELEQLLFRQALAGSAFKKVYFDPVKGRPVAVFVPAEDFVVPYGASDLASCPRYTQLMREYPNEIKKRMVSGFYRDIELPDPSPERTDLMDAEDDIDGATPSWDTDDRHYILEMHVDLNLPGFEDENDIALPYVVTIEKQARKILAIRRNWKENDEKKEKRLHFVHYPYLPGLGFYGSGLIHLVGGIAQSSTSILRQLIDAGTLSNLPAGLKARGLRIKGDSAPLMPGEFRDVDVASGAIKDSITFLPYKEPSAVLYQLLGSLTEEGRRIGSIADVSIGDMNPNAAVGTTLALLERNLKVMSAVQARVHAAMSQEFKLIAEIVAENMGPEYEYDVGEGYSRHEDFDDKVDVLPVSDPNASTMAQRTLQYQAAMQMSQQAPQLYNLPLLHRDTLMVLGIKGADDIVKLPEEQKPQDPVTENMGILKQEPVKAFYDQDHEAHLAVHQAFAEDERIRGLVGQSQNAGAIQAAMEAHIAEHVAFLYRRKIEQQLGVPLPQPGEEVPPEIEASLSQAMAMAAQKLLDEGRAEAQQKAAQEAMDDPLVQAQQAENQIKMADVQRKAQKDMLDAQAKAEKLAIDQEKIKSNERIEGAKILAEIVGKAAVSEVRQITDEK